MDDEQPPAPAPSPSEPAQEPNHDDDRQGTRPTDTTTPLQAPVRVTVGTPIGTGVEMDKANDSSASDTAEPLPRQPTHADKATGIPGELPKDHPKKQPQLRSNVTSQQSKLCSVDRTIPTETSPSQKAHQSKASPTRLPRLYAEGGTLQRTSSGSTIDGSVMPAPPPLNRHSQRVTLPGAFESGSGLHGGDGGAGDIMRDDVAAVDNPDNLASVPTVPIAATLAATDDEIADRVREEMQQQFDERMELEIQERAQERVSGAVSAVAVAEVPTDSSADMFDATMKTASSLTAKGAEGGPSAQQSKRMLYSGLGAVCLVATVLVRSQDDSSNASPTTGSPTAPNMDLYVDRLLPILGHTPTFTKREAFEDTDTPQYKAMEWLSTSYDIDEVQYNIPTGLVAGDNSTELSVGDILNANDISLRHLIERYAAAVFYFATEGPNWPSTQLNFLTQNTSICDWNDADEAGIFCNETDGTVQRLLLNHFALVGTYPMETYCFYNMQIIWVEVNPFLEGTISTFIGSLPELLEFDVGDTKFSGTIPSEIGYAPKLELLYVYGTDIGGSIPTEIGQVSTLGRISLIDSQVGGTLPVEMAQLLNMRYLHLSESLLQGAVPTQFANMKKLEEVWLEGSDLIGNLDPIFCRSDQPLIDELDADCRDDGEDAARVACSCCTNCCFQGGGDCISSWESRPDPCHYGECVWCGDSRFASSCDKCLETGSPGEVANATMGAELCGASCAWDAEMETCGPRTDFE